MFERVVQLSSAPFDGGRFRIMSEMRTVLPDPGRPEIYMAPLAPSGVSPCISMWASLSSGNFGKRKLSRALR